MTCNTMTIRFSSNCFSHFVCLVNISNDCYIKFIRCLFSLNISGGKLLVFNNDFMV